MMEFAVVIVLDDPGFPPVGPVEQRQPAIDRQRGGERKLMRRGHDRKRRAGRGLGAGAHVDACVVDPDADETQRRLLQQLAGEEVARILDPYFVIRLEQGLHDERQRALEPGRDQHLVGAARDIARDAQIARDRVTQRLVAHHVVRMRQLLDVELAHDAGRDLRPLLARKRIERRQAHLEQQRFRRQALAVRFGAPGGRRHQRHRLDRARQRRIDDRAARAVAGREALARQHLVRDLDRPARNAELVARACWPLPKKSVPDLIAAIGRFVDGWNQRCQPFVWVKDADDIMIKATRKRTSGTEH